MEIFKEENEKLNYSEDQKALFEAMASEKEIAEINFIEMVVAKKGNALKFVASEYWVALQSNGDHTEKYDYVEGLANGVPFTFYMKWIKSYKL